MENIVSAGIATGVAEIMTIPIYTIKTNYQNTTNVKELIC